jgi:hypothetical protein
MAKLGAHQLLTRVRPGQPFGNGNLGAQSGSGSWSTTHKSCSGTSTSTTLTLGSSGFTNGDVILIHQTRGTGVGQWEVNMVASGGGTTSLTLTNALNYTYTDSGDSQAQVVLVQEYSTFNPSGTLTLGQTWTGDIGGVAAIAAQGKMTMDEIFSVVGKGFVGSAGGHNVDANQGEGTAGAGSASASANGNGAGGSLAAVDINGGNGGGHAAAGTAGSNSFSSAGGIAGSADGSTTVFGGAGSGAETSLGTVTGSSSGSNGGGIVFLFVKELVVTGAINASGAAVSGEQGESSTSRTTTGGSGAGGSVVICCETATLGTGLVTASAGATLTASGAQPFTGGAGAVGRIAVHYGSSIISGTTTPSATTQQDSRLLIAGGAFIYNLI